MLGRDGYGVGRELACGAFLGLAALGPGLFTGRETAFFYAQTGKNSWLGIALCALLFGIFTGMTAHFAKKTGANNFPQIFRRSMGVYAGGCVWTLHAMALVLAGRLALMALVRSAELTLPLKYAGWTGMGTGMFAAFMLAGKRPGKTEIFAGLAGVIFLLLLLVWGRVPREAELYMRIRLKLEGSFKGMLALALLHGCRCAAVTAGAAAGLGRQIRPGALGAAAGGWTAVLLGLSNAVFRSRSERLMALEEPFAAMCAQWGKAGHFWAAGMLWLGAAAMLACVVFSLRRLLFEEEKKGC